LIELIAIAKAPIIGCKRPKKAAGIAIPL